MKMTHKSAMTSIAMAALLPLLHANAQYKATGEDGVTASPRVRQKLNDQAMTCPCASTTTDSVAYVHASSGRIAASPRLRAQLAERSLVAVPVSPPAVVAARRTHTPIDSIAASPKLMEQMRERVALPQVEIAPITPAR